METLISFTKHEDGGHIEDVLERIKEFLQEGKTFTVKTVDKAIAIYYDCNPVVRFIDYLKKTKEISCDLIIGGADTEASFEWDHDFTQITEAGYKKFKTIMDAPFEVLPNGNIEIFCDNDELGNYFSMAHAGYISTTLYNKYFKGVWAKT